MMYRINYIDGSIRRILIGEKIEFINITTRWIFHPDDNVDLAICLVRSDPEAVIRGMPRDFIGTMDDILEGDDVFFIGFPIGIGAEVEQLYHPIIRAGMIAQKRHRNRFIFEATVFPGSSGSPIFKKPYLLKAPESIEDLQKMNLIGIISGYIEYKDVAISRQTLTPRVIFSENSGLAWAINAECINDILESDEFKEIADPILESIKSGKIQ